MDAQPAPRQPKPNEAWRWCAAGEPTDPTSLLSLSQLGFTCNKPINLRACWTPWSVFQDGSGRSLVVNAANIWPCSYQPTAATTGTTQPDVAGEATPVDSLPTSRALRPQRSTRPTNPNRPPLANRQRPALNSAIQDSPKGLLLTRGTSLPPRQPPLLTPPSWTLPVKQHQSTVCQPTKHCTRRHKAKNKPTASSESAEPALKPAIQNNPYGLLPTRGTGLPPRQPPRRYEANK